MTFEVNIKVDMLWCSNLVWASALCERIKNGNVWNKKVMINGWFSPWFTLNHESCNNDKDNDIFNNVSFSTI